MTGAVVHTTAQRPDHGGGLLYAAALATAVDGELRTPFPTSAEALTAWLPEWAVPDAIDLDRTDVGRPAELRRALADRDHEVCVLETSHVPRLSLARRRVLLTSFPFARPRGVRDRLRLGRIHQTLVNSAFTHRWVNRRWGLSAEVLHPPVRPVPARSKRDLILAVGRFSGGGRSKRQVELVEAFRALDLRGWELHLVGAAEDRDYVAAVERAAEGLAVTLHPDLGRPELDDLYGEASLLWHACGLGIDEDREPDRVEHFGVVTAEAMSAGCVPVVVRRGGQPEIVGTDGATGLLWDDLDGLVGHTRALARDPSRRAELGEAARERATRFHFEAFAPRARDLLLG